MVNKQGGQIRIFMPRYGNINERRHQLHEVIRLSGINLVVNDLDMPLDHQSSLNPKRKNTSLFYRQRRLLQKESNAYRRRWKACLKTTTSAPFSSPKECHRNRKKTQLGARCHTCSWMAGIIIAVVPERILQR
jgi:starch synthase